MARPRRVSDDEVLLAVRRAVLADGPHVSLDVIAGELGVTAPALFRRFGSRNDLFLAALRPGEPPFLNYLDAGPDDRPAEQQLTEVFTHIAQFLATALPCMSALRESGIPLEEIHGGPGTPVPLRAVASIARWLERANRRGLLAVPAPEDTASAMLGAVQAPIFIRHLARRTDAWDATAYGAHLARLFLTGLAPASASTRKTVTSVSQRSASHDRPTPVPPHRPVRPRGARRLPPSGGRR